MHRITRIILLLTAWVVFGPWSGSTLADGQMPERAFIVGQDLGTVRAYRDSGCCLTPDAVTGYVNLYNLFNEATGWSGLGLDPDGQPIDRDIEQGVGKQNLWKLATEFEGGLAIGLELVENHHPGALDQLLAGNYDAEIHHLAGFLSRIDHPVWLRVGYEFDGAWNQGYHDAPRYIAAFRYVVEKLREQNLGDVQMVWQSSTSPVDDLIDGGPEDISAWYPGDDVVDWIGLSWFLGLDEKPTVATGAHAPTQRALMDEVIDFARSRGKPVMIAELAPQGYDLARQENRNITPLWDGPQHGDMQASSSDETWAAWFQPLFDYLDAHADTIRAVAWINTHWESQARWGEPWNEGYWGDHRLQADPVIAERFSKAMDAWRKQP